LEKEMNIIKTVSPSKRFYLCCLICAGIFILSFPIAVLFIPAKVALASLLALTFADLVFLYFSGIRLHSVRAVSKILSLGSSNEVRLIIANHSAHNLQVQIIDELPVQLQKRNFIMDEMLAAGEKKRLVYSIRPLSRGIYHFGKLHIIIFSTLGLLARKISSDLEKESFVYPSIIEMKEFELKTFSEITTSFGIRKLRRIGHSYEFEKIREYVNGDEYRSINWKATGRRAALMVNQYQDEKSQQIFSIIDVSRVMQLPFNGLSLLDYAINTTLVISNIALRKQDKAGLIYFSSKQTTVIPADRSRPQLRRLLEALFNLRDQPLEPNPELLYTTIRRSVKQRSLLFLYTNYESEFAMERVLPILRKLNKIHLLVVVFFENHEITEKGLTESKTLEQIYQQTVAQKFSTMKLQLMQLLRQHGIQTIYTRPEELSTNTVNKYLELKSRGLI